MDRKVYFFKSLMLYFLFWIILAEKIDFQVITIGIIVTGAISLYNLENKKEGYKGKRLLQFEKFKLLTRYVILLIKEVIIASFQVAKIVLAKKLDISPSVITFKTRLKSDLSKTILANSITLTPGTLTIEVTNDEFTVHCITKDQINDVVESKFEDLLLKIEEQ
ncbi:Na+/H+ antiporter subunit E [Wukongibacter baidiensis]|uniref:Na+/H+ antiporter subunit E n=1 Tax=Wukongibacter baidiensis TaxID=1723361 RepID=UPI003D7F8ACF